MADRVEEGTRVAARDLLQEAVRPPARVEVDRETLRTYIVGSEQRIREPQEAIGRYVEEAERQRRSSEGAMKANLRWLRLRDLIMQVLNQAGSNEMTALGAIGAVLALFDQHSKGASFSGPDDVVDAAIHESGCRGEEYGCAGCTAALHQLLNEVWLTTCDPDDGSRPKGDRDIVHEIRRQLRASGVLPEGS